MIIQLNPSIPVMTPKEKAKVLFLQDLSEEHHLYWIVAQDDTGECWTWDNTKIRFQKNITGNRLNISDIK